MFTFLLIACLMATAIAMFTKFPQSLVHKAIESFSLSRVYVFSTVVAILSFSLLGLTTLAYAQDVSTDAAWFQYVFENALNIKTMAPVAIALFISKALLFAFNTPKLGSLLDKLTGKMKLVVSFLLTYVVGVLTVMVVKKVGLPVALFDSGNIPLLGLLLNQVYKQFIVKADEPPKVVPAAVSLR